MSQGFTVTIGKYFFNTGEFNTIYIYKNGFQYIDIIEVGHKFDYDEFVAICNDWVDKMDK